MRITNNPSHGFLSRNSHEWFTGQQPNPSPPKFRSKAVPDSYYKNSVSLSSFKYTVPFEDKQGTFQKCNAERKKGAHLCNL
jgi:hypothetical protein